MNLPPYGDSLKRADLHFQSLKVTAQDTPNMTVKISAGNFWYYTSTGATYIEFAGGNSSTISAPGSNAKWTIITLNSAGSVVLLDGSSASVPVSSIAITPNILTFSLAEGLPKSKQANLLGIRGGVYANALVTTSASWTRTSGCTTFSAGSATGIVTVASGAGVGDAAVFNAKYYDTTSGSFNDSFTAILAA